MSKLTLLKKERDIQVDKKNQLLKSKWEKEEKISQFNKDKLSHRRRNDFLSIEQINLEEKRLKNEIYQLNKDIEKIDEKLHKLDNLIEHEKQIEVNSKFIRDNNLSHNEINKLVVISDSLSKKYQSTINDYTKFLKTLNSFLKEIEDESVYKYINQIKIEIESKKEELHNYKEQCIEFEHLEILKYNLSDANKNLENAELNFNNFKLITKEFDSLTKDFVDFLNSSVLKLRTIDDKYVYPELKQIKIELENKISYLLNIKEECFKLNRLDNLNQVIDDSRKDLFKIKQEFTQSFDKSKNLSIKFDNLMEYYRGFLNSVNSKLHEVEEKFWYADFELMKSEIETKMVSLLYFQDLCAEHNRLDDFNEAITNTKKDLEKTKIDFNKSIEKSKMLSDKFYSTVDNYNAFLLRLDSDLKEIYDDSLIDVYNQMTIGTKAKLDDLLNYQELYSEYNRLDDLNEVIYISNKDLEKIKENFAKIINRNLNELIIKVKSIIGNKSTLYSKLNSELSNLIDNSNKLRVSNDRQELLDKLNEIKISLNQENEKLNSIENELSRVIHNSIDIQLSNNETDKVNSLMDKLNDLNIENFESIILEEEKNYNALLDLEDSESVENLLNELNTCFKKPMFMRQLKRYGLAADEFEEIKNEIKSDIINQVIGENADFKKIIKTRCKEFRNNNVKIDEDEINDLLNNLNLEGIDEDIINECKNKVKQDILDGNISVNNIELKFKTYVNKKINESNQLKELDKIKSDPNVPGIKIHLTHEEVNKIYIVVENEILSEYGISGNVENRVYYLINKKIRENQSEARGRLNVIKRDFSNLTKLNKKEQVDFIHEIEFLINTNDIKYYDISEEYIIKLSNDFINYGKIRLG